MSSPDIESPTTNPPNRKRLGIGIAVLLLSAVGIAFGLRYVYSMRSEQKLDETIKPFADAEMELSEKAFKGLREADNVEYAIWRTNQLMTMASRVRAQGVVAVCLTVSNDDLGSFITNDGQIQEAVAAIQRSRERVVSNLPDDLKSEVNVSTITESDVRKILKERRKVYVMEWDGLLNTLKKDLSTETYSRLVESQKRFSLKEQFSPLSAAPSSEMPTKNGVAPVAAKPPPPLPTANEEAPEPADLPPPDKLEQLLDGKIP